MEQLWLDESNGLRIAAGVPTDIVAPDRLLDTLHKHIAAHGITADIKAFPTHKTPEDEDYVPHKPRPVRGRAFFGITGVHAGRATMSLCHYAILVAVQIELVRVSLRRMNG